MKTALTLALAFVLCGCSYSLDGSACGHGWGWHCSAAETACYRSGNPSSNACAYARFQDEARYTYALGTMAQGVGTLAQLPAQNAAFQEQLDLDAIAHAAAPSFEPPPDAAIH